MSEDIICPISLSPTVYRILKKKAKLQGRAARIHLDFLLRDLFSKEISEEENEENEDDGLFK